MIRVVLADDQALVRAGFRLLLETEDGFEVCAEAADGAEAVQQTRDHHPDVVVMDVRMPGTDGLAATRQITADPDLADTKILVLTTFDIDEYVFEALRAGAAGFLLKDTDPVELLRAIRVVAAGESLLAPTITRRLIAEFVARPDHRRIDHRSLQGLTAREREVLALVAGGLSTRRSRATWSSAQPRPAPTSAASWANSAHVTVLSWSSSPTSPAWSNPADQRRVGRSVNATTNRTTAPDLSTPIPVPGGVPMICVALADGAHVNAVSGEWVGHATQPPGESRTPPRRLLPPGSATSSSPPKALSADSAPTPDCG